MMKIPLEERPRERLVTQGVDSLKCSELIAIILGIGARGLPVTELSQKLLAHFGGLEPLVNASLVELQIIRGIGKAKAIQLKAVFGLAKRLIRDQPTLRTAVTSPERAFFELAELFYGEKQELLAILLLDVKLRPLHREVIGKGILTEVLVHPREVFAPAIRHGAHSLIVAHNHPSQDLQPSKEDFELTNRLRLCGDLLEIPLADHLIISNRGYRSLMSDHNSISLTR